MYTFLKELFFGFDPKMADPEMGLVSISVSDIRKENHKLDMYVERHTKNNASLFRKIPNIKRSRNVLYFFSLNYFPTKLHLEREYKIRNLKPANPNLLLKYFLDYRESFKKYSPAISFFKAKKSTNYSALLVYPDRIDVSIYSKQLDQKIQFNKGFYFCGTRRNFLDRFCDSLSLLAPY